jgi:hypothetical protein
VEENKKLKANVNKNQSALLEQAKKSAVSELESAKKQYKDAYEAGDSDGVLAAQENLTNAKIKSDRLNNFKLPALQEDKKLLLRLQQNPLQSLFKLTKGHQLGKKLTLGSIRTLR